MQSLKTHYCAAKILKYLNGQWAASYTFMIYEL